jgi:hypothetical protein
MRVSGAEVLAEKAKSVSAKHYLLNETDRMTEQYHVYRFSSLSDRLEPLAFSISDQALKVL